MFSFAIPYLAVTILGNSMNIFNLFFFYRGMDLRGVDYETSQILYGMIMTQTNKLTSIPQVLAPGFAIAIVPFVTTAYENKDIKAIKKHILDAIDTVLYLGLPICFCLFALSTEIYYVFYGSSSNYILGGEVLAWASLLAIAGTISPVVNGLMMAVRLRKANFYILLIGFVFKGISIIPLIYYTGYSGAITSSAITTFIIIMLDVIVIKRKYHVSFKYTIRKMLLMLISLLAMYGSFELLKLIGLNAIQESWLLSIFNLGVFGLIGIIVYIGVSCILQLPQSIFKKDFSSIFRRLKRR